MTEVGSYYIFGPKAGGYATMPRNFTMTAPGLPDTNIQDHSGYLQFEHKFDDNWKLTAQTSYFKYIQQGYSSWPSAVGPSTTANGPIGNGDIIRNVGIWDADSNMFLGQIFVNGKFNTGPISHKILGGIDLGDKDYMADWGQSHDLDTAANPFNIYNPNYGTPSNGFPQFDHETPLSQRAGGLYGTEYAAGYIQDELGFFENKLRVTLAARYTWIKMTSSYQDPQEDSHITPRAGVSYSITKDFAVYGLYDQAFLPQSAVVTNGKLRPLTGNNLEFGVKKDWFDGSWNTSLSAYRIIKKNEITADPNSTPQNPLSMILGEKRAQGVEFDLRGKIFDGLNLIANYAFTESIVTESNVTGIKVGDIVPGYAKHTANAWLNYTVQSGKIKGLGASIGGTFLDGRQTDTWGEGLERLPSYFKLDGGLSYEIGKVKVTANVFNILDKYLYSGSYYTWLEAYYWQAEPGRNFRVVVSYKF
jgi:iron complex outermembrane receptor protein